MTSSTPGLSVSSVAHGQETIKVGSQLLEWIPSDIIQIVPSSTYVVITDSNIFKLFGDKFVSAFSKEVANLQGKSNLIVKVLEPGEPTKCREVKAQIEDWMINNGCNRDTCVVALGGGVIGDLSGFVASTFMRGVPVIQIPTTLLAMVDSSIGGKTGVDTDVAKNLVGSFHHPKVIYIDTSLLSTLPKREFSNGMAEVIKTAAIRDAELFSILENNTDRILDERNQDLLQKVILRTGGIKAHVVSLDEREGGLRSILNFGHTIGHAIEAIVTPEMLHGECVSIGMVLETQLAYKMGLLENPAAIGRLIRSVRTVLPSLTAISCLSSYKLPLHLPKFLTAEDLFAKMTLDKKNLGKKIRTTILLNIGKVVENPVAVDNEKLRQVLMPHISVIPTVINGEISVPGSKSISNRVLPICGLGEGPCRVRGLLQADDTRVMLDSLKEFGIQFHWEDDGTTLVIAESQEKGIKKFSPPSKPLFLGNAGTASRFLTTLVTMIEGGTSTLTGSQRLKERPIRDLTDALLKKGCHIKFTEKEGFFPIKVHGEGLPGGVIDLSSNVSSQYVSSILLSAPYAKSPVELRLHGGQVSRPFIDMTTALMSQFGISVETPDENTFRVPLGRYQNPPVFTIESDASSASYPLALAAITGGEVTVHNIGSASIQGDAKFYTVLEAMGCTATQTATSTTVKGPANGKLRAVSVNMDFMTDTFMTICAVAAVAEGTTVITGIANQRVKECNRILAMVTELAKLGVVARELEDGLEVDGVAGDISKLHGGNIECYLDHRIAMSFAVLGTRVPGIVILDKECVDKTYPEFWMDLESKFGVKLEVPELKSQSLTSKAASAVRNVVTTLSEAVGLNPHGSAEPSVVLVGMRGSGKSTMGAALARGLGWPFVDLDNEFVAFTGQPIQGFVTEHGWSVFRQKEEECLRSVLSLHPTGTVISTGGGIVETPSAKKFLANYHGLVLQISRDTDDVMALLESDQTRAKLGEAPLDIWKRRSPLYHECSKLQFHVKKMENQWSKAEGELIDFVQRWDLRFKNVLMGGRNLGLKEVVDVSSLESSFFLSLTVGNVDTLEGVFTRISADVQAIELRVDLLDNTDAEYLAQQVALLRRYSPLPIIWTLRTQPQGGKFTGKPEEYFRLNELGLRLGCEFIDVEACHSLDHTTKFLNKLASTRSKAIISYHDFDSPTSTQNFQRMLQSCLRYVSLGHVIKLVGMARNHQDCYVLFTFLERVKTGNVLKGKPIIAICAGSAGRLTRVTNLTMTPVTHPELPVPAAPGQLSAAEILSTRMTLGFDGAAASVFYLFGSPISASLSPLLHNTGFRALNLDARYSYELFDTTNITNVVSKLREKGTAGGSVTIPHKQSIIPYLDHVTESAKAVGAVNTVTKTEDGRLVGDNTDWVAIDTLLRRRYVPLHGEERKLTSLVVGAGGTSNAAVYALVKGGHQVFIYNRTLKAAQLLAARKFWGNRSRFPGVTVLEDISEFSKKLEGRKLDVVIATVPPAANFTLPHDLIHDRIITIELVYNPRDTPLLQQVRAAGAAAGVVEGLEILFEQGLAQFQLFTKRKAPRSEIGEAFLSHRGANDLKLLLN
ncbi:pentafunctional AROM polypeptide [Planoprotostelium fungivorum]|uniref:Pentafunctional AROM polypeptide n=1 Tax=Planoprotostelium fungivorum TaxID=1890364 RepID=A0A2P6MUJ3_9EUKA|nr:pentafunctional AROM polypeptide [Planoprotostelium fungivorum]